MKKLFSFLYPLCWICLCWGVLAAMPDALLSSLTQGSETGASPSWLMPLVGVLMCVLLLLLVQLVLSMTPQQIRTVRTTAKTTFLLLLCLAGVYVRRAVPSVTRLGEVLGGVMVGLLLMVAVALIPLFFHQNYNKTAALWKMVLLTAATIGVTLWVPHMWGLSLPTVTLPGDLLSYHIGQLSLTFVTISVMSVLSDKSIIIYWENVAEAKLIKPVFGSFASYTAYSIACAVGAGISVLLNNGLAFVVFLALNVVALILLTLTMVDVYFNREQKKQRLAEQLLTADNRTCTDMMYHLQEHLYQRIESHDMLFVREVAELYGGYLPCFDSAEGRKVKALLDETDMDIPAQMVEGIGARVERMKQKHEKPEMMFVDVWCEDFALWNAIATCPEHKGIATHPRMCRVVKNRMDLLLIDVLANNAKLAQVHAMPYHRIVEMTLPPYRLTPSARRKMTYGFQQFMWRYCPEAPSAEGELTLKEKLEGAGVRREATKKVAVLLTGLLRVVAGLSQTDNAQTKLFAHHPLLVALEPYWERLDLSEQEEAILRKHLS